MRDKGATGCARRTFQGGLFRAAFNVFANQAQTNIPAKTDDHDGDTDSSGYANSADNVSLNRTEVSRSQSSGLRNGSNGSSRTSCCNCNFFRHKSPIYIYRQNAEGLKRHAQWHIRKATPGPRSQQTKHPSSSLLTCLET
ncbi:hypothetical protein [Methylomonas fluvii]|nr:hypothetical protein [Methylomonas fluvii]